MEYGKSICQIAIFEYALPKNGIKLICKIVIKAIISHYSINSIYSCKI